MVNLKMKKRIFAILAMFALLLSGVAGITNSYNSASASFMNMCGDVGSNMGRSGLSKTLTSVSNPDSPSRKWTVDELFAGSVKHSKYYGEHEGNFFRADTSERGKGMPGYEDVKERLEMTSACFPGSGIGDTIANTGIGAAQIITGLTGSFVMFLIGKDETTRVLADIVGGKNASDTGLIGTFFDGFYMPLVVIAALIMIVTIIYKGLIQFKLREALGSLIWSLGAFIIGVALMLNPQLLAGAPQAATSTITTCVIGAISGQNCLTGDIATPSVLASKECLSTVTGGEDSESMVSSMNCMVWKAFVLEPWAEVTFGEPYNDLYTDNVPSGGSKWNNIPEDEEMIALTNNYCINLKSSKSYNQAGSAIEMDISDSDSKVCNAALYHLFLKTNMKDTKFQNGNNFDSDNVIQKIENGTKYDSRWYHLAIPMASDESKWDNWRGHSGAKHSTSFISFIGVVAAASILLVLSVFGGAYKVIGTVLIAFAPIFLLFAIEPTRGRKIFLGWLESLISSILKYFAIAVMVIVALVMYAGLLSNTTGVTSLVGIIVLTVALHMYRKEIVDLIGATNMGGQRVSNKAAELAEKTGKQVKEKSSAAVGGAIGGAAGSMLNRRSNVKSRKKTEKDLGRKSKEAQKEIDEIEDELKDATTDEERDRLKDRKLELEQERDTYDDEREKEKKLRKDESGGAIRGNIAAARKGSFKGSIDSTRRSMKRGTGAAANVFQQMDRTQSSLGSQSKDENIAQLDEENKRRRQEFEVKRNANKLAREEGKGIDDKITEKEYNIQLERQRSEIPKGNPKDISLDSEMALDELKSLDKFAEELTKETDKGIIEALNDESIMSDPNKKAQVNRELSARLETRAKLGMTVGSLGKESFATRNMSDEDAAKIKPDLLIDFKKAETEIIENLHDNHKREEDIENYGEKMRAEGISREEVNKIKDNLREGNKEHKRQIVDTNISEIDKSLFEKMKLGEIHSDTDSYEEIVKVHNTPEEAAEVLHNEAFGFVKDKENITAKEIKSAMKENRGTDLSDEVAEELLERMKLKEDVEIVTDNKGKKKVIVKQQSSGNKTDDKIDPVNNGPTSTEKERTETNNEIDPINIDPTERVIRNEDSKDVGDDIGIDNSEDGEEDDGWNPNSPPDDED